MTVPAGALTEPFLNFMVYVCVCVTACLQATCYPQAPQVPPSQNSTRSIQHSKTFPFKTCIGGIILPMCLDTPPSVPNFGVSESRGAFLGVPICFQTYPFFLFTPFADHPSSSPFSWHLLALFPPCVQAAKGLEDVSGGMCLGKVQERALAT